ncbi:hypothetical protein [Amycolatopsis methanolica]|uniref:Uncharacterized protein n=1 Tax=Amycolatopsis methanolica 239 TaxID=1068978 RepID=A0A076MYU1_AMYME|nr:hypothetical protein [Amycolatopsis methanolica]AIJ26374.1 hypothetical protein AMETH_6282 [Amycolatopsis methanolica 239]AIJ26433.1 hypothetical protein AMETH_6341 [Amycolatopsis methanolica 239]
MDDKFADDRFYGVRYHESAGEDLYRVAGRILSDLKVDQHEGRMPSTVILVVAVAGNTITVQAHVQDNAEFEQWTAQTIRARATTVSDRYNWRGVNNRADVRFKFGCTVRVVRGRLDAKHLGSIIG